MGKKANHRTTFDISTVGDPKDLDWKNAKFLELEQLRAGVQTGASYQKDMADKIKETGLKAVPALHRLLHFNIYLDILLVGTID